MSKSDYQMTTVCKYVELLDQELKPEENKISIAAEKYLVAIRKNRNNALLLEKLLA